MKTSKLTLLFLILFGSLHANAQDFKCGVLLEEFTSQFCPFSPRGDAYVDSVNAYMPQNAVSILWHSGYLVDDYSIKAGDTVSGTFGISAVPYMLTNRSSSSGVSSLTTSDPLYSSLKMNAANDPSFEIRIMNEMYDPINMKVECDVYVQPNSGTVLLGEDSIQYSITALMTEDKIVDWQWHDFSGNLDTLTHNNIVRVVGGKVLGDKISFKNSLVARLHYTFKLATKWNPSNMKIKSFISLSKKIKPLGYNVLNAIQTTENASAYPTKPIGKLVLLYPAAGDTLDPGIPVSIFWNQVSGKENDKMVLSYSSDNGITWQDIAPVSNSYSYVWHYPSDIIEKPILLSIVDLSDSSLHATSGAFYIMKRGMRTIASVQISDGPELLIGTTHIITWKAVGEMSDMVDIQLSVNGGLTYKTIFPSIPTSSGMSGIVWTVPSTISSSALIRVLSRDGISGVSQQFTIVDKTTRNINNIHIAGLPNVISSRDALITWDVSGNIGETVEIALSEGHDTGYSPIVSDLSVSGAASEYLWHVPDTMISHAYLRIKSSDGVIGYSQMFSIVQTSGVSNRYELISPELNQNYPNPFNSITRIGYSIPASGQITLSVSDVLGKEVVRIYNNDFQLQGKHELDFNSKELPSGTYFITLLTTTSVLQRKMIIQN